MLKEKPKLGSVNLIKVQNYGTNKLEFLKQKIILGENKIYIANIVVQKYQSKGFSPFQSEFFQQALQYVILFLIIKFLLFQLSPIASFKKASIHIPKLSPSNIPNLNWNEIEKQLKIQLLEKNISVFVYVIIFLK